VIGLPECRADAGSWAAILRARRGHLGGPNEDSIQRRHRSGRRRYRRLAGAEAYTARDGRELNLWRWQGQCMDCGAPFVVRTAYSDPDPRQARRGVSVAVIAAPHDARTFRDRDISAVLRTAEMSVPVSRFVPVVPVSLKVS
jgi:hypothetical protein